MQQLKRSMMERYEIAACRPTREAALLFGANQAMLGVAARLLHQLNEAGGNLGAVSISAAAEALRAQDCLFTLLIRGEDEDGRAVSRECVVQSVLRAIDPNIEPDVLLEAATGANLRFAFAPADCDDDALSALSRALYARFVAGLSPLRTIVVDEFASAESSARLRDVLTALSRALENGEGFVRWLDAGGISALLAESLSGRLSASERARAQRGMNYRDDFIGWAEPFFRCTLEGESAPELQAVLSTRDFAHACALKARIFDAVRFLCAPAGFLCGKHSFSDALSDETLRAWLGGAFYEELLPELMASGAAPADEIRAEVIRAFDRLGNAMNDMPLLALARRLLGQLPKTILPAIKGYAARNYEAPPKTTLALAAAIMLYSGARPSADGEGYEVLRGDERAQLFDDTEILEAFSQLAHDVPAETLAYAALADRSLWGEDLREIDGLELRLTSCLSAIQRIGFPEALRWLNA